MLKTLLMTTILAGTALVGTAQADYDGKMKKADKATMNIVEVVTSKDKFSTLASALTEAELVETIENADNITVFAPTNDAFAKLPAGTLDNLLKPENKAQLQAILKYHVVGTEVMSDDIAMGMSSVVSLQGDTIDVNKTNKGVMIDSAKVKYADIKTENGVIHVIDNVILPE